MVDFATQKDYEDIAKVWRISFSDTDSYIKQFWDTMFRPENTLVYRIEGVAVAMYFFIEAQTVIKGRCYSTYYLYAAATLPKYRGRGYMAQMIEKGFEVASQRKIDFIVLVPAEDYLFDYYAKFGFITKFKKKSLTLSHKQVFSLIKKCEEIEDTDLFRIRQIALAPYDFLNWGADALNYAAKEHLYTYGSIVLSENGYAMYTQGKDTLYIKEICSTVSIGEIFYLLLKHEDVRNFVLNLPVDFPIDTCDKKIVNVGMMKALNADAENIMQKIDNAYIGLSFG